MRKTCLPHGAHTVAILGFNSDCTYMCVGWRGEMKVWEDQSPTRQSQVAITSQGSTCTVVTLNTEREERTCEMAKEVGQLPLAPAKLEKRIYSFSSHQSRMICQRDGDSSLNYLANSYGGPVVCELRYQAIGVGE